MWNNIFVLYILNVLIHNTITCTAPCLPYHHPVNSVLDPELCVDVKINTDCPKMFTNNTYSYMIGDNITLSCVRKTLNYSSDPATLVWKLKQHDKEFMVTSESHNQPKPKSVYQIRTTLDSYDHHLFATCESERDKMSIEVHFELKSSANTDTVFENINYTEGETVRNTLKKTVFVYSGSNFKEDNQIGPENNIYDQITAKDNGSIYTAWFEKQLDPDQNNLIDNFKDYKRILYKKKWKIFVIPTPGPSLRVEEAESNFPTVAVIAGVISLFIILLLTICVYYKYIKKRETVEEPVYWEPTHVVYAQIDHKISDAPVPVRPEGHYATIIGIFKSKKIPITTIGAHQSSVA